MRDFRASDAVYICDECGDELKIISSAQDEQYTGWWIDLECRECGPQGREWIEDSGTIE